MSRSRKVMLSIAYILLAMVAVSSIIEVAGQSICIRKNVIDTGIMEVFKPITLINATTTMMQGCGDPPMWMIYFENSLSAIVCVLSIIALFGFYFSKSYLIAPWIVFNLFALTPSVISIEFDFFFYVTESGERFYLDVLKLLAKITAWVVVAQVYASTTQRLSGDLELEEVGNNLEKKENLNEE